jgi:hypothetical protein
MSCLVGRAAIGGYPSPFSGSRLYTTCGHPVDNRSTLLASDRRRSIQSAPSSRLGHAVPTAVLGACVRMGCSSVAFSRPD